MAIPMTGQLEERGSSAQLDISPDGNWVGFFHEGWLKKVHLHGGPPVTICALGPGPEIGGGSWGTDGSIYFSVADRIQKVRAVGGQPETVAKPDEGKGEFMLHLPEILPGNQAVLLTLGDEDVLSSGSCDDCKIVLLSLETGERKVVIRGAAGAR